MPAILTVTASFLNVPCDFMFSLHVDGLQDAFISLCTSLIYDIKHDQYIAVYLLVKLYTYLIVLMLQHICTHFLYSTPTLFSLISTLSYAQLT